MSLETFFPEVEAIDLCLKLVDLLELIHQRNVVHTNLCPDEIFLKDKDIDQMQFLNLYHCAKDPKGDIGFKYISESKDISKFDIRTRNSFYISPEQVHAGKELNDIAEINNGKIDHENQAIIDFITENDAKITKKCDIYSLGAILYKFLIGTAPPARISQVIGQKRLQENSPNANVYEVPFFATKRVLSNEMCMILVKLLHDNPKHRFKDLKEIK